MKKLETQDEISIRLKFESEYKARFLAYIDKQIECWNLKLWAKVWISSLFMWFDNLERANLKASQNHKRKKININY